MPKTKRCPQLTTRLSSEDLRRFRELALSKGITQSEFLRDCALLGIKYEQQEKLIDLESPLLDELQEAKTININTTIAVEAILGLLANAVGKEEAQEQVNLARRKVLAKIEPRKIQLTEKATA